MPERRGFPSAHRGWIAAIARPSFTGGVAGGQSAISGAVAVGVVRNPVSALIGDGADVRAAGDVAVQAISVNELATT